nr:reverse transcriptase domain-containing protein [Tanacetum cinerariifolium]
MIFNIDSAMKHSYSNDDTCSGIDVIDEILEEDYDALLDEGSKILHSIEGTLLEEEILSKFDEFMEMTADENFESESDTDEPPFEKITINTDYKIKTSIEEHPMDLELKPLPDNLEYAGKTGVWHEQCTFKLEGIREFGDFTRAHGKACPVNEFYDMFSCWKGRERLNTRVLERARRALRRGATVKMSRMAMSMGITGLSKNLLQMHVREECLHSNLKLVVYLKEMFGTGNLQ